MSRLPARYRWLLDEPGPRILMAGLATYGMMEVPGRASNPLIMEMADEIGVRRQYTDDAVPWCGLWMGAIARRAGWDVVDAPLWARSWSTWGREAPEAMLGDVLVFSRNGGGHVGVYVGEDRAHYHVLGGNQSDSVNIARIAKARCIARRQPNWRIAPPANRRVVRLAAAGPVSENEA